MSFHSRRQDSSRQQPGFRQLGLESLEARLPLAADFHLLSDVNQTLTDLGSDIGEIVVIGETAYFTANDGVTGKELWKSDGTPEGTMRVKDIFPGDKGSNPTYLTEFHGVLYFAASDHEVSDFFSSTRDVELWRSDGTEAGTYRVKDLVAGDQASTPRQLMNFGGSLFFSALEPHGGFNSLWKSDGTESGTEMVVVPGDAAQPNISSFMGVAGGTLLLTSGSELWRSDGTGPGTFLLRDFSYFGHDQPKLLASTGATAYFAAKDDENGLGVWKTDGTVEGTILVSNVKPMSFYSKLVPGASIGDTLIFAGSDSEHGEELWRSDGTPEGTVLLKDIRPGSYTSPWGSGPNSSRPFEFTTIDGVVYFVASSPAGTGLWKTDGTTDGTVLVKNMGFDSQPSVHLTNVGGKLYFHSVNGHLSELWTSDGTEAGTFRIKDIAEGSRGSYPRLLTEFNGGAIFMASDIAHGAELWKTDGTEAGTTFIKDILPATAGSNPSLATNVAGAIFFRANNGLVGEELWASGGDAATTRLIKDIRPGLESSQIRYLTEVGGTAFFTANDGVSGVELWKSDGTTEGTALVRDIFVGSGGSDVNSLVNVNGTLYFSANDGMAGVELWRSDGTAAGTVRVKDIAAGPTSSSVSNLVNVDGVLYFSANDGIAGRELWRSDGTEQGTILVKDIFPGSSGSSAAQLINVAGLLYFSASDSNSNGELWKSDGTEAGTMLVKDIVPGPNGSWPHSFANINGELYFSTSKEFTNGELWKSNGTETVIVKAPIISVGESPMSRMAVGQIGTITFVVELGWYNGPSALWSTDGTEAGTAILVYSDLISSFTMWGDYLYFTRYGTQFDQPYDLELWRSDGTRAGTELVKDFSNGYRSSFSGWDALKVINDRLVLTRNTDRYGTELWVSDLPAASQPGDYDVNGNVDGADFLAWQRGFGGAVTPAGSGADGDGSGAVDAGDLAVWAEHFGEGSASGAAAGAMALEMAESELVAPVSLAAAEGGALGEGFFAKPQAVSGRDWKAAGDLAGVAQREANGREALGGRVWDRAAVRREEVAEASSPRRAVAASLDAAFDSLGTSLRRERLVRMPVGGEFDDAAAWLEEIAKPRAAELASGGLWGESGEGAPGR